VGNEPICAHHLRQEHCSKYQTAGHAAFENYVPVAGKAGHVSSLSMAIGLGF
jgi:hypothetical protein